MKLELRSVDQHKPPIVLEEFPVIVGLDPMADVCLDDSSLGHYQCMIDHSDDELMVWDLGTRTGTLINGVRVSPKAPLRCGDELTIGKNRFVVSCGNGAAESRAAERDGRDDSLASPTRRRHEAAALS
jgi:pSer/pThr/pTyr-binding forkhead associated (FHA) protein